MSKADAKRGAGARRSLPGGVGFVLAIALVWLGGQFVTQGLSDQFLSFSPGLAVLWRGDSPDALAALSRQALAAKDDHAAERFAVAALRRAPLNALALTTIGEAEDQMGHPQLAEQAMTLAGERGWRDPLTQIWLFKNRLLSQRFDAAFKHADALLRRQEVAPKVAFRILGIMGRDPPAVGPLVDRLAENPVWRGPFLSFLSTDPDPHWSAVEQTLLTRLAAGSTPPSNEEMAAFLLRLVREGRYADAEAAWRQLTPGAATAASFVHNGDFSRPAAGTPFDWTLTNGVGWTASIEPAPGGGKALKLEYDGFSVPHPLRQLIVLAPGAYTLSGRALIEPPGAGAGRLAWLVVCADSMQPLAKWPVAGDVTGVWRPFSVELTVPPANCSAQWLLLGAQPGDEESDVDAWFDDLSVARSEAAVPRRAS